jgi:hypothetical protein
MATAHRSTSPCHRLLLPLLVLLLALAPVSPAPRAQDAASGPHVFAPVADARVEEAEPDRTFGGDETLTADKEPHREAYLRFDVTGITAPIQRAVLRLYATGGTSNGPYVAASSDTAWTEAAVTWNSRPAVGEPIANTGEVADNAVVEFDVTPAVTGDGSYTFALIPDSDNGLYFNSREAESNTPQLVIITGAAAIAPTTSPSTPVAAASGEPAILLAAGDIAGCNWDADEATAQLVESQPGTVATLGDNAYGDGTAEQFAECYDPTWGRFKDRTKPAPGNHDYNTNGASGYYAYFGAAAGDPAKGYYSYALGAWHVIVLNSNIDMSAGSPQEQWLRNDLAAHPAACTLAYWHHPRFSSGGSHGNDEDTAPLFQALYGAGAEIVLSGHEHDYERFAPQTPDAQPDPNFGIREFVVGTGGAQFYDFDPPQPNSEVRNNDTHGVLKLTLNPDGYTWEFLPVAGASFTDSGSGTCHDAPTGTP